MEHPMSVGGQPDHSQGIAYIDGKYVPMDEARISILDWGFIRSDCTYDVVHVWKGKFFRLADHIERFQRGLRGLHLSLPLTGDDIAKIVTECVRRSGLRDSYVEMICTRGTPPPGAPRLPTRCVNRFFAFAIPYVWIFTPEEQAKGAKIIVSSVPRIPPDSVDPRIKNFQRGDFTQALFEAEAKGADTAVLLDRDGFVTEGPGFNVFAVVDDQVFTPDRGVLEGITRRSVLELCADEGVPAQVGRLTAEALRNADEVFLASTAGGIMPVIQVDDRILSNGAPGPLSNRLRRRYWERHDEGWHATPIDYA
jgi:branched-chain amino acid aminotransferase